MWMRNTQKPPNSSLDWIPFTKEAFDSTWSSELRSPSREWWSCLVRNYTSCQRIWQIRNLMLWTLGRERKFHYLLGWVFNPGEHVEGCSNQCWPLYCPHRTLEHDSWFPLDYLDLFGHWVCTKARGVSEKPEQQQIVWQACHSVMKCDMHPARKEGLDCCTL